MEAQEPLILIVEDHPATAEALTHLLKGLYQVAHVGTGNGALLFCKRKTVSAVILDLGLPDIPGTVVIQRLRAATVTQPILVITAEHSEEIAITALQQGADAVLTKPLRKEVILAQLQALVRRTNQNSQENVQSTLLHHEGILFDDLRSAISVGGRWVSLRPREFAIVQYLARVDRVVSRQEILSQLPPTMQGSQAQTVTVHVKRARDRFQQELGRPLVISARGAGYYFDPHPRAVTHVYER